MNTTLDERGTTYWNPALTGSASAAAASSFTPVTEHDAFAPNATSSVTVAATSCQSFGFDTVTSPLIAQLLSV